jgi:hypothetical protein
MPALLPVILTAAQLVLVAQDVPQLNIEPSCQAAAFAAVGEGRDKNACLQNEQDARNKLKDQWDQFSEASRERCVRLSHTGGHPSYVEVLTCLQMAKAAKKLPDRDFTTGRGD